MWPAAVVLTKIILVKFTFEQIVHFGLPAREYKVWTPSSKKCFSTAYFPKAQK